jgi:ATP-dependent Clp protease ATP-binding subunit ClpC
MQEEAKRFEHAFMGTEHLLLAMAREPQSLAAKCLVNLGADLEEVLIQVERVLGRRGALYTGAGGLTTRCQRVIEQAAQLARESDNRTVGTGHLLRGLVAEPEDAASQLLDRMGVTAARVAKELERLGYDTEEASQPGGR